jgi:hypothetical protein
MTRLLHGGIVARQPSPPSCSLPRRPFAPWRGGARSALEDPPAAPYAATWPNVGACVPTRGHQVLGSLRADGSAHCA